MALFGSGCGINTVGAVSSAMGSVSAGESTGKTNKNEYQGREENKRDDGRCFSVYNVSLAVILEYLRFEIYHFYDLVSILLY